MDQLFPNRYVTGLVLLGVAFLPFTAVAQGLSVGSGAHLVVNGTAHLQLHDANFVNDGSFVPSSGVVGISGTGVSGSTVGGTSVLTFNTLQIDRSAGALILQKDIEVTGSVNMVNNNIELNNHVLDLGTTGSLAGEQNSSRVTGLTGGYIRSVATLNAPGAANPGNLGVEITSPVNMGVTEIRRAHAPFIVSPADQSINRYFNITPAVNNNLDADLKFYYFDGELNIANENDLQFWSSTDNGVDWNLYQRDNINTTANYVTMTGLDTLNHITLSTNIINATPLGLTLLSFDAKLVGRQALLNWSTVNEVSTSHFEIERSADGTGFGRIGTLAALGNTSSDHSYSYVDAFPYSGANYYRIRMVDADGSYRYSRIAVVKNEQYNRDAVLEVYPIPAISSVNIRLVSTAAVTTKAGIFDVSGSLVGEHSVELKEGEQVIALPLEALASGNYYVRFNGLNLGVIKLVRE